LEIELSDCEAENATLKCDFFWQVVEIVIGGIPTVIEVRFVCLFMFLGIILLQGFIPTTLFNQMRYKLDLQKVPVGIQLFGNLYLVANLILQGIYFVLLLGWRLSLSNFSSSTFRFFMSSMLRALALALTYLPACPTKKTSFKV